MLNRVTISTLLKTVIMTLGIAVIVMLSLTAWDSWNRLASANQAEAAANAEGHLFTALYNMRIDRATTGIDLNSDRTGVSQVLGKSRAAEMAALQSALEYLPQVDFPDQPAMTTELADRFKRIQESHDETAAALAQPKASRPAGLAESAFKEANELFGLIDKLSTRVATSIKLQDAFIDQMMEIKQLAWTMRNISGDATLVILNPLGGKPVSPTAMNDYNSYVSKYTVTWASLKDLAAGLTLPTRLTDMIKKVDQVFFDPDYAAQRMKVLTALIAGQPSGTNSDEWSTISITRQAPIQDTAIIALDVAKERAADLHSRAMWSLIVQLCLMACAIAGVTAMMWVVSFRVSNPLHQLSAAMRKLAGGDFDVVLPGLERKDEIGAVANAVERFKVLAVDKARNEADAAMARQKAEAERHAEAARAEAEVQAKVSAERAKASEEQAYAFRTLGAALGRLADGDFTIRLDDDIPEAYAQIRDDFNLAIGRLHETIQAVADSTSEVGNAAVEISTATNDLSQRVEEQAASLEETSSSMEEISATVKTNAQNAQQANALTNSTRGVADRGGKVVAEAVTAMARIEESSRQISDIITVIDEIARQTNLLALNAAVEAARAGDAGRGFAVVASEVRSLAQRSSEAAKNINDLIAKSSDRVQEGVGLVNRAGTALSEIVDSIKQVADIVAGIAAASAEQSTGLEQINRALTEMDEATQRNSALVEENSATAKTLEQQSQDMQERISSFKLDAGHAVSSAKRNAA